MAKRKFEVTLTTTAIIEIDGAVINAVDDDWRKTFYNLKTAEQIAEHLAYNLVVNDAYINDLDGFADQPEDNAKVVERSHWDIEVEEIKD